MSELGYHNLTWLSRNKKMALFNQLNNHFFDSNNKIMRIFRVRRRSLCLKRYDHFKAISSVQIDRWSLSEPLTINLKTQDLSNCLIKRNLNHFEKYHDARIWFDCKNFARSVFSHRTPLGLLSISRVMVNACNFLNFKSLNKWLRTFFMNRSLF